MYKSAKTFIKATIISTSLLLPLDAIYADTAGRNPYAHDISLDNDAPTQTPDLEWQPTTFSYRPGTNTKYIDFVNGNDNNPGTRNKPWKHHPWDRNATGKAEQSTGTDTYVFKRGVVYRGVLIAKESGTKDTPIRLTLDPTWGIGDAVISGSLAVNDPWSQCTDSEQHTLPKDSRTKTWCTTIHSSDAPRLLWEIHEEDTNRIPVARHPNWGITDPDDPRSEWLELNGVTLEVQVSLEDTSGYSIGDLIRPANSGPSKSNGTYKIINVKKGNILIESSNWVKNELKKGSLITNGRKVARILDIWGTHKINRRLIDPEGLTSLSRDYYKDAVIWSEGSNIPKPYAARITSSNPDEQSLTANFHLSANSGPAKYTRYFLEGLPQFLDTAGEYYYKKISTKSWRIFLRLPGDRNPNNSHIEAAQNPFILDLTDKHHIEVSGLFFGFSNHLNVDAEDALFAPLHASAIRIRGTSSNINIHHCHFHHLPAGIVAFPSVDGDRGLLDNLSITDNTFHDIDGSAIALSNGRHHFSAKKTGSRLIHTSVLRNKLDDIGYRTLGHWAAGSHGHGIEVTGGEITEVAENHVNNVWGSGIAVFLGGDYESGKQTWPYINGVIHHNKVTNSVLGLQDYGGIAAWQGGPVYIYNNISGNPVGYKFEHDRQEKFKNSHRSSSFGLGIYLDGQYKGYVFNNIVWGNNNNINDHIYNAGAFKEAMGFMHIIFNNTFYRFGVGLEKDMPQHNRNFYIGNLFIDMGDKQIYQNLNPDIIDYSTLAYSRNIFAGRTPVFGRLGHGGSSFTYKTLETWKQDMQERSMFVYDTGIQANDSQTVDANNLNFLPLPDSEVIDKGARIFVPAPLHQVVGEWNFYGNKDNPTIIFGENLNMNKEWTHRSMFNSIPRNNLNCPNTVFNDFAFGMLEDWVPGALHFNGTEHYCELTDSTLKRSYTYTMRSNIAGAITSSERDTVDITTGDFLIETVISPDPGHTNGGIVSKSSRNGYSLEIDEGGRALLSIKTSNQHYSRSSSAPVNDGQWHHIIAEVDRSSPQGINIYLDGKLANGQWTGDHQISTESLSNSADFLVGRIDNKYYSGLMDFLRISKGTLIDAETTIEDLYEWNFNGPFLRDFSGNSITGNRRDAGALEYQ